MIQYDNAQIGEVVTHFVGNRLLEDGVTISKAPVSQTEELRFTLRRFLLSSFEIDESWHFTHETGLEFNVVWSLCRDIFKHPELLYDKSVDIAKYLYDQCNHNKIKGGELCMVYFTDVMLDGDTMDAIGIFKSEEKDTDGGFVVKVVDNTNKVDALYWMTDFLGVASCRDEYSNTKHAMAMAKNFVTKELPKEYNISKNDQITLLGKTLDYFKGKEEFDVDEFTGEVFEDKVVAETFNRYKEQYEAKNDIEIEDHFGISAPACERQQRVYKRVIKLDNNVRIYITGSRDQVVQGEDEYGKVYKVYYEEESI